MSTLPIVSVVPLSLVPVVAQTIGEHMQVATQVALFRQILVVPLILSLQLPAQSNKPKPAVPPQYT